MQLWIVPVNDRVPLFYGPLLPERLPLQRSALWRRHGSNGSSIWKWSCQTNLTTKRWPKWPAPRTWRRLRQQMQYVKFMCWSSYALEHHEPGRSSQSLAGTTA